MWRRKMAWLMDKTGIQSLICATAPWSGVLCLNYHRIGDGRLSVFDRGLWSADETGFEQHVRFLKSNFDVVVPSDLTEIRRRATGRYVLLTFDDGYRDNYEVAFPILKRNGIRAAFFVATGFLDSPRLPWWDEIAWMVRSSTERSIVSSRWLSAPVLFDEPERERAVRVFLRAYKAMPGDSNEAFLDHLAEATGSGRYDSPEGKAVWMTWPMLREMRAAGMVIGGHTVSHPVLARLTLERQWEEISRCGQRLVEEIGEPMRSFSYPVGGLQSFNDDTRTCLHRAGVEHAFSYYGGYRAPGDWDKYDVRRIAIESDMTPEWVRAVITLPSVFGRAQ